MIRKIAQIVIRNRRDYDTMVMEILNFLRHYSERAERAWYFLMLDEKYECNGFELKKNGTLTHTWKEW